MIREDALEMRAVIGKLETMAADLGLTNPEVAAVLGRPAREWPMPIAAQWSPMERWQEARLRDLSEVCRMLAGTTGAEAVLWLRRPTGSAGITPLDLMMSDRGALRALRDVLRMERGTAR